MDYTITVDKTFAQAIEGLLQSLQDSQFGVLWEVDMSETLAKKGVEYNNKLRIFEVCNPHHAKTALESNIRAAYFLPCKIVVYRDGGKTKIGMVKPTVLIDALDDPGLVGFAQSVEKELMAIIAGVR